MIEKLVKETTAFFNKQYRDMPDGSFLLKLQAAFIGKLNEFYSGRLPDHLFYADDLFVVYRNLGFLKDPLFRLALEESQADSILLGRVWRLWVLSWTMAQRWRVGGAFVDCGAYDGTALEVAIRYNLMLNGRNDGKFFACDLFDNPPTEARKAKHGPTLHQLVQTRLSQLIDSTVVKGPLPKSLESVETGPITWCQIDLNSAEADLYTFQHVQNRLMPGAIVIFDDYGFSRYADTQRELDSVIKSDGGLVLELPTGQGLFINQ